MADPVSGAEHAAGGAGAFLQKRVGPLPLWAYGAGVGVAFLALRVVGGKGGSPAKVTGQGVAVGAPINTSPGGASGSGSFVAPAPVVAPPIVNIVIPGYSQPNGVTSTVGAGPPSAQSTTSASGPTAIVTTPKVTAPSSGIGAAPVAVSGGAPGQVFTNVGGTPIAFNAHADAPVVGGPMAAPTAAVQGSGLGSPFGGPGSGPARTDVQGVAPPPTFTRQYFENN